MVADNDNRRDRDCPAMVAVSDDYEARLWADRFAVSCDALRRAVEAVGSDPDQVEAWLTERLA